MEVIFTYTERINVAQPDTSDRIMDMMQKNKEYDTRVNWTDLISLRF